MAFGISKTYRSLLRVKDIATVLTRHGLGHVVDLLDLTEHVPFLSRLTRLARPQEPAPPFDMLGQRLVRVIEELGPTFIKFGQLLSGRPDILPEAWLPEFRKLQDRVPPFDSDVALHIVEHELGCPVAEAFSDFASVPLASGSMAQAHEARLLDGTPVIVKVQRPEVERQVHVDIDLLQNLAVLAETYIEELRVVQPTMIIDEFARGLRKELDFVIEATQTAKFHDQLSTLEGIRGPAVYWELTTSRMLVIEKLPGSNIGDFDRLARLGIDRAVLADVLAGAFMRQYFEAGLFHADPHPGNILVDDTGTIGLIDFGMVGHLSSKLRDDLGTALLAIVRDDMELVVQIYTDVGALHPTTDAEAAKGDLLEMLDKYFSAPLNKVSANDFYVDVISVARKHRIVLPRDFVLFGKSLVTISTLCRELDPNFSLARAVQPHLWGVVRQKLSPLRWLNLAALQFHNISGLASSFPGEAKRLLGQLKRGELRQIRQLEGLEPLTEAIEHSASRLALAIFLGALVVGSSLLASAGQVPQMALAGYVVGALVGLWLVIDILRASGSRRPPE